MTPPTQDDLAAGRELDALIAEKIMGWRNWTGSDQSGLIGGTWTPSTSIDTAWQVVETLREKGTLIIVGPWLPGGWAAWISYAPVYAPDLSQIDHAFADTAPLAICKAALRLLGSSPDP